MFDSVATNSFISAEYSPDGTRIVVTGNDEVDEETGDRTPLVQVFDAMTGAELHRLKRHPSRTGRAYYTSDGSRIYSIGTSGDQYICVWDAATGALLDAWEVDKLSGGFAVSSDERYIAVERRFAKSSVIRIIDAVTGDSLNEFPFDSAYAVGLTWTPDNREILVSGGSSYDLTDTVPVRRIDVATGNVTTTTFGRNKVVFGMMFSRDGKRLVTFGDEAVIRVWDVTSGQELYHLEGAHVNRGRFSPDERQLAFAGYVNTLIWTLPPSTSSVPVAGYALDHTTVVCRPNPSTTSTDVCFHLENPGRVEVQVLDSQGAVVIPGIDRSMDAGDQAIEIDVSALSAGAYFCVVQIEGRAMVQPLRVMR